MSFVSGFFKVAGVGAGLRHAGNQTVKEVLSLKGLREAGNDIRRGYKGKYKDLFKTPRGRADLGEAVTKSLPSAVAATGYGIAAKKSYDAMDSASKNNYDYQ